MVQLNTRVFDNVIRQFPGFCNVSKLTIAGIDAANQWVQIDDFESIFDATKSGRISMVDTKNLIASIPILGKEIVEMTISDGVRTVDLKFRIYKIADRRQPKPGVLTYTLHLCSEEAWRDAFIRVSKSYSNKAFDVVVKDILTDENFLNSKKSLITGETSGQRSIIIPYWSPLHAIAWVGGRTESPDSSYGGGTFLFFETIDGFKFASIDNFVDDLSNIPYCTLKWNPIRHAVQDKETYDPRVPRDILNLEDLAIENTLDTLDNTRRGMFSNRVRVVDAAARSWKETDYNYIKSFSERKHLKGLDGAKPEPMSGTSIDSSDYPDANLRLVVKCKGLFDSDQDGGNNIEEWLPAKVSRLQQLKNYCVVGTLPGHLGLTAGMIVNLAIPSPVNVSVKNTIEADKAHSGQYLVTSVRRLIHRDRFILRIELSKDSRGT